ncbi:hypothetical protein HID58_065740, partial [Brassica napus]
PNQKEVPDNKLRYSLFNSEREREEDRGHTHIPFWFALPQTDEEPEKKNKEDMEKSRLERG